MIPTHYVWLAWACSFLVPRLILFLALPRFRPLMLWSSLVCLPFGFTEPFFLGTYWDPPSLFDLARRCHIDIETFIYCFAIGGVAPLLYHLFFDQPAVVRPKTEREFRFQLAYNVALLAPSVVFAATLLVVQRPLVAGLLGFAIGILGRLACRPDLTIKTLLGGPLFLLYYLAFLVLLDCIAPGYFERVWLASGPAHVRILGLPVSELAFACAFGMYWSGLYEHVLWSIAWPESLQAQRSKRAFNPSNHANGLGESSRPGWSALAWLRHR
jgi:hypothetical protein